MAGTGKKSSQKLVWLKKNVPGGYLGKHGFKSVRQRMHREFLSINVGDIDRRSKAFESDGLLKGKELNLEGYKVLGDGEMTQKLTITAEKFSQSAKEKIEKAGGKLVSKGVKSLMIFGHARCERRQVRQNKGELEKSPICVSVAAVGGEGFIGPRTRNPRRCAALQRHSRGRCCRCRL